MRRSVLVVAVIATFLVPGVALAARANGPSISAITVRANGGTWPTCNQTVTISVTGSQSPLNVSVTPHPVEQGWSGTFWGRVKGTGSVEVQVQNNYHAIAGPDTWRWYVELHVGRKVMSYQTTWFTFAGACPATGIIATLS